MKPPFSVLAAAIMCRGANLAGIDTIVGTDLHSINSPVPKATADDPDVFDALNLDHLVRILLRGVANAFDQGLRTDDDGLRVSISTRSVEYLGVY